MPKINEVKVSIEKSLKRVLKKYGVGVSVNPKIKVTKNGRQIRSDASSSYLSGNDCKIIVTLQQ